MAPVHIPHWPFEERPDMTRNLFDEECYALACHFLDGEPLESEDNRRELAYAIQSAVEDWLAESEDNYGG